jgi:rfaE bifunctional protein nucleotidyltransferase chain/domain
LFNQKIKTLDELERMVAQLKQDGKKVVLCHGTFELVHPGHLYHFEEAKKQGDVLVVSITADKFINKGPNRPVFPEAVRAKSLASLEIIDFVIINPEVAAIELLKILKPDIYFKGQEYEKGLKDPNRNLFKEAEAVRSMGGEIMFSYAPVFSSTKFLKDYFDLYPKKVKEFLEDFKFQASDLINGLKSLRDMKVLLIGETIIDEYNYCKGMAKTPKDNIVATKFINKEVFAGGILACANHLAGFCNEVHVCTALGSKNSYYDFIKTNLKPNVKAKYFYDKQGQTIVKKRFIDPTFFTKMFEAYYFDDRELAKETKKEIIEYLEKTIKDYDLVVVHDYGNGFFDKNLIELIRQKAKFLAVNTQTNSANFGFNVITKYSNADYVCIDEPEARLAVRMRDENVYEVVKKVFSQAKPKNLIVTRGHLGCLAIKQDKVLEFPALSTKLVDRMGAGDAFFGVTSACMARGMPIEAVAFIGNAVGALKVTIVGNKSSVEYYSLYKFIQNLLK